MPITPSARAMCRAVSLYAILSGACSISTGAHAQIASADRSAGSAQPDGNDHSSEDIIVTASRRETTIRQTPTAISAYGGQQLEKEHVLTFADLTTQSPNIQFGANGGNTDVAIRGIGTNLQTAGSEPGVALHVDGVYFSDPALALLTLLDVKRVEILRGPQGTLFGRNATGGAVNIISNTPTTALADGFSLSAGVPLGDHVNGFVSGPLNASGTLLARVAFEQTFERGDVQNTAPTGPRRLDDRNDYAGRLQLEWRPTGSFSARLQADYEKSSTAGPPYYLVGTPNTAVGLPAQLTTTFVGTRNDDQIAVSQGIANLENKSVGLFLNWDIGGGHLSATVSQRHTGNFRDYDGDGTAVEFTSTLVTQYRDSTYGELLYSSDDSKPFSFILGTNYFHDKELQNVDVAVAGFPAPVMLFGDVRTESFAGFGHIQYRLTTKWKIFGGARYSTDRKSLAESNNFVGNLRQSARFSKPTFEVGSSYDLNRSTTGYIKYATGYKSGGYSAGSLAPAFAPETDRMVEAGLKGTYFGGFLEGNVSLFHINYSDLQVNQVVGLASQVTNAARAKIDGAEVELNLHLSPALRLQVDGGWLNARFESFQTGDSARPQLGLLDLSGNHLPQAPKFTVGVGPTYSRPLADGGRLTLSTRYDFKSRVYFSEFNLPLVSQAPVGLLSAYASYDLPGEKFQIGVYGRNLTDERVYSSMVVDSAVLNSITLATIQPRREFGISLRGRF